MRTLSTFYIIDAYVLTTVFLWIDMHINTHIVYVAHSLEGTIILRRLFGHPSVPSSSEASDEVSFLLKTFQEKICQGFDNWSPYVGKPLLHQVFWFFSSIFQFSGLFLTLIIIQRYGALSDCYALLLRILDHSRIRYGWFLKRAQYQLGCSTILS